MLSPSVFSTILVVILIQCWSSGEVHGQRSIIDYGAVPNNNTDAAASINSVALNRTLAIANASSSVGQDRVVLIPQGFSFYVFHTFVNRIHDVTIQLDGIILANDNITAWPAPPNWYTFGVITLYKCSGVTLQGSGTFDGQGYQWWWTVLFTSVDQRPHLLVCELCEHFSIDGVRFRNSPMYHIDLPDVYNVTIRNIDIWVDVEGQQDLFNRRASLDARASATHGSGSGGRSTILRARGGERGAKPAQTIGSGDGPPIWSKEWRETVSKDDFRLDELPLFPLNTDGIDPAGSMILIENVTIQNFDDAVAVKPLTSNSFYSSCSENMVIRDFRVSYSVGMSIGSVPPNIGTNCIRNITIENVFMDHPIKAIYVKTNPGTTGDGIIDSITYRNLTAKTSLWYPIWIGPQQQEQPGTAGTGCSFEYPVNPSCPTQSRVNVSNIILEDITLDVGLTLPGVILCNATNPCTNFTFSNVINRGKWAVQDSYVCENVIQSTVVGSDPTPSCF